MRASLWTIPVPVVVHRSASCESVSATWKRKLQKPSVDSRAQSLYPKYVAVQPRVSTRRINMPSRRACPAGNRVSNRVAEACRVPQWCALRPQFAV